LLQREFASSLRRKGNLLQDHEIINMTDTLPRCPAMHGLRLLHFLAGEVHVLCSEELEGGLFGWRHSGGDLFIYHNHDWHSCNIKG
jgi:hypothetical protein